MDLPSEALSLEKLVALLYEMQKYMPIAIWRGQNLQRAKAFKQKSLALAATLGLEPRHV